MEEKSNHPMRAARTLIIGVMAVLLTLSLVLIIQAITQSGEPVDTGEVDVFANSTNECILCHQEETPGIIKQYSQSTMAAAGVACEELPCSATRISRFRCTCRNLCT